MKKVRKIENRLFICEECNKTFKNRKGLGCHIGSKHHTKNYYDMWLKEENESFCKICKKETQFINLKTGYRQTCSKKCNFILFSNIFDNSDQESILIKRKQTCLEKYGVENVYQSKEIKEKCKKIHLEKLGVENPSQSEKIKKKKEQTCLKNHGVKYGQQNKEIFEKTQKTRWNLKKYKDTNIYYRGTYEFDFLENFYDKYPDIENGKGIKYFFEDNQHYYFPDFYIPSLNLIVEVKNSYLVKRYTNNIKAKEKATIINSFKYIMIIDKKYNDFNKFIENL